MTRRRVLDFSNYTGVPSAAKIGELMLLAGWEGVILGTQNPAITRRQYRACADADFHVDALYVFVYWDQEDWHRLDEAIALADELGLPVWLDCEWMKTGYPGGSSEAPAPANLVRLIWEYKAKLGAHYAGIYTGSWWWPEHTQDSKEFSADPLWHAAYGGGEPDFADFRSYGGWLRPVLWQYSSGGTQGVTADLNIEETAGALVTPPQTQEITMPTDNDQILALLALAHFIRNGWNLADLSDGDKAAIRAAAVRVPA